MNDQIPTVIDLGGAGSGAPASDVPELREGPPLDLPEGAVLNADGSVTLSFDEPVKLQYRPSGGGAVREDLFESLVLRRLKGRQMLRIMDAKKARASTLALSLSSGVPEAKLTLLYGAMGAPDLTAARSVVMQLIGATDEDGLPACAELQGDGSIVLPLAFPATDGDDEEHTELTFKRLRAEALVAMQSGRDVLAIGLQRGVGLSKKAADGLIEDMDALDLTNVQRVIGFLSGIGRKTGG